MRTLHVTNNVTLIHLLCRNEAFNENSTCDK